MEKHKFIKVYFCGDYNLFIVYDKLCYNNMIAIL